MELLSTTFKASKFNIVSIVDAASSSISSNVQASPLSIYEVSAMAPQDDASGLIEKDCRINVCEESVSCNVVAAEQSAFVLANGVAQDMRGIAQYTPPKSRSRITLGDILAPADTVQALGNSCVEGNAAPYPQPRDATADKANASPNVPMPPPQVSVG